MAFKIGSLFDGSGGFPLAASLCGGTPVWASEVEPYPIAVTKSRFPNMKHLGSVTDVKGNEVEPVDVITFGSPCQDLSVAGKRAGLKHEDNGDEETTRSGLFMEAVRIIKEMREATNGVYQRFAIWENVPGAFSSNKGEDFRTVCEELIKIVEPGATVPAVPKNGWPYADCYCGDGWSLAYRVYDAQYWGVPQRRRRIYLVADFGGECAGKISFEREGLRGYFAESRSPWQGTAADAENGVGADDRGRAFGCDVYNHTITGDKAATLSANSCITATRNGPTVAVPYTLKIRSGCEGGGKGALIQTDKSATLSTLNDQYLFQPIILEPIAYIDGDKIGKAERSGGSGLGIRDGNKMYTLTAKDAGTHGVAFQTYQKVTGPLMANSHPGSYTGQDAFSDMLVAGAFCPETGGNDPSRNVAFQEELSPTLSAGFAPATVIGKAESTLKIRYIVRRLTPTECARLQGFADAWAVPDSKEELTEEEYRFWLTVRNTHAEINGKAVKDYTKAQMLTWYNKLHTDSSEYKLWGNGIALPTALYVMQGIADVLNQ